MIDRPMTLVEHLEELRTRLLIAVGAVAAGAAVAYLFVDPTMALLIRPAGSVVFLGPAEGFFTRIKVALLLGAFVASPVILYQVWRFVAVGLTRAERRAVLWVLPSAVVLFVGGALFALLAVLPVTVRILLDLGSAPGIRPMLALGQYLGFVATFALGFGVMFQLPIVMLFLTKIGVVSYPLLARGRKYAVLVIFIAAGVLTPGPDVFSQFMMALPALVLYEASVWIARFAAPRAATREAQSHG